MDKIQELKDKLAELREAANAVIAQADSEQRDATEDELETVGNYLSEFSETKQQLETRERLAAMSASEGRKTAAQQPETRSQDDTPPRVSGGEFRNDDKQRWGWRDFGEQALAIRAAGDKVRPYVDKRLETRAPTTYGSEGVGADGGFAVAPAFATEIKMKVQGEESLLGRTNGLLTGSNAWSQPTDETTPWQTTGGVQAAWEGENDQLTQSKPALKETSVKLNKLAALVPVTEELLSDAPGIGSYLSRQVPKKMGFKIDLAILQGTGVGQPLGILNSASLVSVAKVASQTADTLVGINVINMWARLYAPSRANAVWLINQDVEPQLDTLMKIGKTDLGADDSGWGVPLYLPANGLSGAGFSTIKGRPVIATQACNTLGDKGDIILADLSEYLTIQKTSGGMRVDSSIHLFFDYDTTAFRFIFRLGGKPWWDSTISPRSGSATLSPFVTLDARA